MENKLIIKINNKERTGEYSMSFMDLLNETLPSKKRSSGYMTESFIDDEDILLESILDEMFQDGDPQSDPDMPDDGEERDKSMKNEGCRREGCGEEGCRSEGCGEEGCRGGYCEGDDEDEEDEEEDEFDIGMFGGDDDYVLYTYVFSHKNMHFLQILFIQFKNLNLS